MGTRIFHIHVPGCLIDSYSMWRLKLPYAFAPMFKFSCAHGLTYFPLWTATLIFEFFVPVAPTPLFEEFSTRTEP